MAISILHNILRAYWAKWRGFGWNLMKKRKSRRKEPKKT